MAKEKDKKKDKAPKEKTKNKVLETLKKPLKKVAEKADKKSKKNKGISDAEIKATGNEKPKFDQTRKVEKLSLIFIIVNRGQGLGIYKILREVNCSFFSSMFGEGTAAKYLTDLISSQYEAGKEIVLGVVTEKMYQDLKPKLDERFKTSDATKGVAFKVDFSKMVSVFSYRFLANVRN